MRVAMISEHASPLAMLGGVDAGGQNLHVAELATALGRHGHEVRVYTRRDHMRLPPELPFAHGVTVVHVPAGPAEPMPKDDLLPYMTPFGRWLAAQWLDGWAPDVTHAHFWMSGLAAVVARRFVPCAVVQTFHALGTVKRRHQRGQDTSPAQRIALERSLGLRVDRVIAQCRDEVRELEQLGVPPTRIAMIPSGVDSSTFCPHGPAAARTAQLARILSVGRLVERKGFADLIRALPLVPSAQLVIAGGPPRADVRHDPEAVRLRQIAADCRVQPRVRLLGAVAREEMPRWYRSADLLACTPWYEPFGLTALEGMASGVPVVASAVGGLADTVVDGVTGALVPPRDPVALGRALHGLLGDPARRVRYGAAGVYRARARYSWDSAAQRLSTVYEQAHADCRQAGARTVAAVAVAP